MSYSRFCTLLALLGAVLLPAPIGARPVTEPAVITALAAEAYLWGLGPEFIERSSQYNTIIGAPFNALKYSTVPAAWNNGFTNAGDASVLYVTGFVDFAKSPELVLTVPRSSDQYYVVAYYDAYANTIASIGTRTTPSDDALTSYLLVGPRSPHAHKPTAKIGGYEYRVVASDTDVNFFLIRVLTNTLIDASDPTSVPNVGADVVRKFALNTLHEFQKNGHSPIYPTSIDLPPPTQDQIDAARQYKNAPTKAVDFFAQVGAAVAGSPIPKRNTGLSGTAVSDLPAWMVQQYGTQTTYSVPSYGQKAIFDSFAPLGLTEKGFRMPTDWGQAEQDALQAGYVLGQKTLDEFIAQAAAGGDTNDWGILNDMVGTYPNNAEGYLFRSLIVVEGGVANIPLDAVYPTNLGPFDGNNTYKVTFATGSQGLPAVGIYPPMVTDEAGGDPKGFWSIHVYASDPNESTAPFIAQTSVLNTSYSIAETSVLKVDATTHSMTVKAPDWGTLVASTPILFGGDAIAYGLAPDTVYYVASVPTANSDNTEYTFTVSTQWLQKLSHGPDGDVPIQGTDGEPGPLVNLLSPAGAGALTYGMVQPVTQLGSSQLAANQLVKNADDGSLTIWFGPTLPDGAPPSNWIPTPSSAYYGELYPNRKISTAFQLTLRMYYPTPGSEPPSILPCTDACPSGMPESYIPPQVELVQQGQ